LSILPKSGAAELGIRGPGGHLEAAGAIAGVFQLTLSTLEGCSAHSKFLERSNSVGRAYIQRNKPDFMAVMQRLPALAYKSGGEPEVARTQRELESGLTQIETAGRGAKDAAKQNPQNCTSFLDRVERRELDLRRTNSEHFKRLGV